MNKIVFNGVEYFFYQENLFNDNLPLIKFGAQTITTKTAKKHLDNIIFITSTLINAGAVVDDKLEKYSKALDVFNAIRAIFSGKPLKITAEMVKLAIEVVQEIGLMEEKDPNLRMGIKSAAFAAKLFIDVVSRDE